MNIEATRTGTTVVIKVVGRLDADNAPKFEQACKAWVEQGARTLVIDMSELTYVSSMGLRSFMVIGKDLTEHSGALHLCGLTGLVKQVFEITRLNTVFTMHSSVDSALAAT